jgi:hypothetical protein
LKDITARMSRIFCLVIVVYRQRFPLAVLVITNKYLLVLDN